MLLLFWLLLALPSRKGRSASLPESKPGSKLNFLLKTVHNLDVNPELLDELMSDEVAMSEGDIRLSDDRNAVGNIWPTLKIPFSISPELASRTEDLLAAMAMVSKHTCVTFYQRTSEPDYLLFKTSKGCSSYVGFVGGEQGVFVGPRCTVGNIVHELLHALGFHHEHTRTDREEYITILHHNIMKGREKNFRMREGQTFQLPYDLSSILHYGSGFFSSNGLPTIIPKKDTEEMGQRVRLTENDIQRVRQLYHCDSFEPHKKPKLFEDFGGGGHHNPTTPPPSNSTLQELNTTTRGQDGATTPSPDSSMQEPNTTTRGQHLTINFTTTSPEFYLQELNITIRGRFKANYTTPPDSTLQELTSTTRGQDDADNVTTLASESTL